MGGGQSDDANVSAYYAKFRSAAQRGDKATVASLTAFPFERNYDSDAEQFSRSEFIVYPDERFSTLCEKYDTDDNCAVPHFFKKIAGTYKLTEVVNDTRGPIATVSGS